MARAGFGSHEYLLLRVNLEGLNRSMRPGQNRRVRGRTRNKGPNPLTRSFESNGPDVKIRGTAQHIADKYAQLARDAQASSDPVSAENYLQHAEHYYRLIAAAQEQFKQQYGAFQRSDEEGDDGDEDLQGPNGFGHPGERMNQDEFGDGGYGQPAYEGRPNGGERPAQPPRYDRNDRGEYRNDRQDRNDAYRGGDNRGGDNRGGDNRGGDNYRNGGDRGQRFDRNAPNDRNVSNDRNAPNGAAPDRAAQGYDRGEGQRPEQPRNGVDARPDGARPEGGRPDGNRRDRFNRDANREPNRGDAPRQDGGRRDAARPDRGPRQEQQRQEQPRQEPSRQEQPRQEQSRQEQSRQDTPREQPRHDAPRYAQSDEIEEAGLPAFLMNPVRPPVTSQSVPDDVPAPRVAAAQVAPAPSGAEERSDNPADGDVVSGIKPRRRRVRKVADALPDAQGMADDTPVD